MRPMTVDTGNKQVMHEQVINGRYQQGFNRALSRQ